MLPRRPTEGGRLDLSRGRLYVADMLADRGHAHVALRVFAFVVLAIAVIAIAGTSFALMLAPAGLLVLMLLFGRYPGERVIHRLAGRVASVRAVCQIRVPRAPRSLGAGAAALALPGAGRAPPTGALI